MKTSEAPTASPNLTDLTPEQRAVLMLRLRQKAARREEKEVPLAPVPRDRPLPLAFGQQRMWLVDRWQPGNPAYNLPFAFRISGGLDREALQWAFGEIVRRHEILRTAVFQGVGGDLQSGEPVQVVLPAEPFPLPRVDLTGLPEEVRLPEALRLTDEESRAPFDFIQGRPFRAALLSLGPADEALVTVVHHIAADAWSLTIFQRELTALYAAHVQDLPSPLPELPIQFADFAVWQRERMKGELAAQLEHWKRRLAGASPRLELPVDRPRPPFPSGLGARRQFRMPQPLLAELQGLARRQGTTLFMTLLAAFQALLSRLAGQDDVSVGSPVAGRSREELEGLIGCFINTLVLRADLSADPPFRDLLEQVRDTTLAAFANQDVPFEQVVEAVEPEREPGRTPLFQVMFTFQNEPTSDEGLPGVEFDSLNFEVETAMFDLTLDLKEIAGRLVGGIELSLDLYDESTVERFLGHYLTLLAEVVADPGRPVSELPLLGEAERHAVLTEWNAERGGHLTDETAPFVHRRFAEQARRQPEAPAVSWEGGTWTYAELRRRAGSLARHLRALGVGPDVRVGISAGRTPERVAAVLAVFEAGGVFVPLDPEYPRDRLAWLVEDSRPAVLLAEERYRGRLPDELPPGSRFLALEEAWEDGAAGDGLLFPLDTGLDPEHIAYLIYTSGSTGRPKGVPVTHRALARVTQAWTVEYGFGERVRSVLQLAGFSFDIYLADLVRALTNGGRLILCPADVVIDPPALAALLAREEPEFVDLVPALLREVVGALEETGGTLPFRLLSAGADAWPVEDLERTARLLRPGARMINSYGVTEASIDVSFLDCAEPAALQLGRLSGPSAPIGRPFAGARMVVADRWMRPVPIGVVGELWIGGPNLARGYFGRPDLTAERFVPDPFAAYHGEPGARAYRTGDRVRRLADGVVEFLGRVDHQIKIRGLRIEPGEVEAGLGLHPGVRRSVVVAVGEGAARRLAAFVVPADPSAPPDPASLRAVLRERLPEPLLPAAFEILDALPLTPNGKVDRKGLAQRATRLAPERPETAKAMPRTPLEEIVAGIFAEVLGGGLAVGVHDDFFDLGGHSLIATQVVSRLRAACGVEVSLRRLFEAPTVAGLAAEVAAEMKAALGRGGVELEAEIRPVPRDGRELPLSFAQERLWFLEQLLPGIGLYNMPLAVRLGGALGAPGIALLERSLAAVAARHEVLRTVYPSVAGRPVQRIGDFPEIALPRVDLDGLPAARRDAEARERMAELAALPFDLASGAPWRALLLRLAPEEHRLAVVIHHIAADGWSLDVMEREVARLYAGEELPPLAIQYADYAVWQRERLRGEGEARELAYWRERLAGLPPSIDLPFDRPRPAVPSGRGASRSFVLPGLGAPLRALARRSGSTLFMALAAGLQALLARLSGQGDVALGTPIAGRDRVETEGLIGLFVNTLVLRADVTDDPAFQGGLLPRVREAALGAYAHQTLPFERVVEELQPERVLSHTPLFQVMLALQNTPPSAGIAVEGMSFQPIGVERQAAAFELGFQVFEAGDTLYGSVEYATDLFDAPTVERTLGHLGALLDGVAAQPAARVSELPLLSEAERHQIEVEWREGMAPAGFPRLPWVHRSFERQAARTPDAVALIAGGEELTFGELDRRADRLARQLRREGVGRGVRVGTLIERSPELAVAMLAIWKAGGVYVPLDPAWPAERRALLLEDSGVSRVLEGEKDLRDIKDPRDEKDEGEAVELAPDDPAYVLFTSGSTGRPKGVVVEHRNFAAFLEADQELTGWHPGDVMAWSGPIGFDASLWEIWTPLLAGARCHILPAGPGADPRAWAEILPRLTFVHAVPGLMRQLLDAVREAGPPYPRLRAVHTGGEAIPVELLAEMRQLFPEARLRVQYGPTETTVFSATWDVAPGEVPVRSWIGRPVPGTEIRVLDAAGGPVPVGVAGEIWIGGPGVARGYLNREEETAARFPVMDGRRFYRTGDRARWRPGGELEFRGRGDDQVKIRGFRVEPGEVEAVLSAAPGVLEAAVVVREDLPGGRGLVAYAALDGDGAAGLREYLRDRLPSYMIPARVVAVDRLPRTAVGKVDRRALAGRDLAPEEGTAAAEISASGPVQELMAALWSEVLETAKVGPRDDFFALGGHSLLAAQVIARVRAAFGVELPLRTLFEAPTVAGLAARVVESLRARDEGAVPAPPLVAGLAEAAGGDPPLSFAQERLWFLEQLQPGTAAYHIPLAVRLRGRPDAGTLAASLQAVAARHEALRTRFPVVEGRPVQRVEPEGAVLLEQIDLSGLAADPREEAARALMEQEAARPFDLAAESPLRACLLRLAPDDHLLLVVLHHIAADGWSVGILTRELAAFYAGRGQELPALPVQYADFALWQRRWLEGEELERQLRFWRRHLEGHPGLLPLPLDRPRPAVQTFRGAGTAHRLGPGLTAALRDLSRRSGATLFMVLLAGLDALLGRLAGETEVVVGVPSANRDRLETEGLIGLFVNTLALRVSLAGEPTFAGLLARVREAVLAGAAHQDLPFEKLVAELSPERHLAYSPIFQVLFQVQHARALPLELPGIEASFAGTENRTAIFDLVLDFQESGDGLWGIWLFNTDLFDRSTVERMARHLEVLLHGAAGSGSEIAVADLPWLAEPERHQLLLEWNPPAGPEPAASFPELFAAQAARTPDAPALIGEEGTLTYAELADLARRGAGRLVSQGIGPDSIVALAAPRGPELIPAILAVLQAGGAWLPLDPGQPEKRLAAILAQAGALLTLSRDGIATLASDLPSRGACASPDPANLAYLIATSGSTGEPKLVMVEHRGMLNHLRAKIADLGLTAADTVAQTAPHTFDISVWQSLAALLVGGRVRVYPDEVAHDPARLLAAVARDGVTVLEVVPSLLAAILETLPEPRPELPRLRWLISTGEALPPEVARRWLAAYPEVPLINGYGPSEASDRVSHYRVAAPAVSAASSVPIGRPLPNLRLQVVEPLGRGLAPLPIGVAGELGIGGAGVGRGYRGDPARTAEAFVPDPAGTAREEPGARLYLTGDLARFLADGNLELLGRRDHQVKVRGFRIETGEVEAALRLCPEVREAAVALRGGRLVAYAVPRDLSLPAEDLAVALRAALRESLPAYMVPTAFVKLAALPLGPSGKVDRRALPDPLAEAGSRPGEPPRTPLESLLAGMWREVLGEGGPPVGVSDSFFELGGDSIRGAIFVNRLGSRLGVAIPVAALFEAPTVAELAAALEARYPEAVARCLGEDGAGEMPFPEESSRGAGLPRWPETEPAPLSFAQERLWFLHQLDPDGAAYNMGESLLLRGKLDVAALALAFREVTRRHDTLRTRFEVRDGGIQAWTGPAPETLLPWVDLSGLVTERAWEEGGRLAREESLRPFDLEHGPVLRAVLLRLGADDHALLFTSHHIACDGWSLGLWAREIELLYKAFSRGEPSPLPELPARYADFAAWQRGWLQGPALEAQLAYWRERLRDAPPYLELPLDRSRPAFQTYGGELASLRLAPELADRLRSLSGRHNASLFMTLLAAFQLHLKRLSGQDDVVVGSPIAGRTRPEVEELIGCFLNTLALRTDLSGNPPFLDLLRRVRETALGAFSYQDVPFEKLLEELRPERDTSRPSLFQVLFNMLNAPRADLDLPGVDVGRFGGSGVFAKFDLTLYVSEEAGGLTLDLVYNADLFEPERMREMLRQYRQLLEQVAAAPEQPLDRYALLTPEAAAVLPDPAASLVHPWPGAVQDLFAAWARRTPEKVALSDRDGDWTYGELDDAVQRLAARLWADGIRPGDRVAIYAHRSAALAWALLGILKAGAAFTILDPIYPAPRLIDRLRMAEPRGLLHLEGAGPLPAELAAYLEAQEHPCRLVLPAGDRERATAPVAGQSVPESWPAMGPYDVASVAFTSGSTGLPKGIVQTHGSMSYFLPWHQEDLGFTDADRHTMLSGLAHDPLHRDTFYCLGTGATLYVPDPDRIGEPGYLAGWMKDRGVTVTNMTPAMGKLLVELGGGALPRADARGRAPSARPEIQLPDLRVAILAGDLLTREVVAQIRRLAPRAVFLNVYGATESQRALSFHIVEEERGRRLKQTLPLGKGKKGSQLLVLTSAGLRAGIGELGEVVIRSPHLAQGYLKDEAQTEAKYGTNPFAGEPGDRIYRTGDLGRYLPDGDVEAAGRADQQVKIRGFRVEPGEVEAELLRAPGVKETVVVARSIASDGDRQLVAYLVLDPHGPAEIPDLRERLRQSLPAYMVPSAWVTLEKLPVNPNGKIDRLALPAPEAAARTGRESVPPRDELERQLAAIWEEVLETSPVGVTDDFFDLGGHSLLAVRLMARIQTDLGRTLPLSALFQAGTVAGLAELVREGAEAVPVSPLVLLKPGDPGRRPLFLVHPVGGEVLIYSELVRQLDPARPVYAFQAVREAAEGAPASLPSLAAEYLKYLHTVQPRGPYLLAGWSLGGRIAFDMARQLDEAGEKLDFLGLIDTGLAEQEGQPPWEDEAVLRAFTMDLPREYLANIGPDTADPLGTLLDNLAGAGQLPAGFDPEPVRRHFAILKEHLELVRGDVPRPYRGRMTFFAAEIPPPEAPPEPEPSHGWAALAGETELHWIPGDHVTMIQDSANLRILVDKLEACLTRAETERLSER